LSITGCVTWLDATDTSSLTFVSGNNVSTWKDKSTTNLTFTCDTTANAVYNASDTSFNNMPSLYFGSTGACRYTSLLPQNIIPSGVGVTIFIMYSSKGSLTAPISDNTSGWGTVLSTSGGSGYLEMYYGNGYVSNRFWTSTTQNFVPNILFTNHIPRLYVISIDATTTPTWKEWYNGANFWTSTVVTGSTFGVTNTTTSMYLGSRSDKTTYLYGRISEVIIYKSVLSQTDYQKVEGYLAWKWKTNGQLPTNHPYYNSAP
jgi:hypothetical protein